MAGVLGASILTACWPAASSAVQYRVEVCTSAGAAEDQVPSTEPDGVTTGLVGGSGPIFVEACNSGGLGTGTARVGTSGGTANEPGEGFWRLNAPPGAKILTLTATQAFFRNGPPSFLKWDLFSSSGTTLFHYNNDGRAFFPPEERKTYTINAAAVQGALFCFGLTAEHCTGGEFSATLTDVIAILDDEAPPAFFGPIQVPPGALRGDALVRFNAFDPGSGIAAAALVVDGARLPVVEDDNGGRCHEPFKYVVPCRATVNGVLPLDTRQFVDGSHEVQVVLTDATGQETVSAAAPFAVRNAPENSARPAIRGIAAVGQTLSVEPGRWVGAPTSFEYQWLRCPGGASPEAGAAGCEPIAAASDSEYALTAADLGHREMVEITAQNSAGSGVALSLLSELVLAPSKAAPPKRTGPVISHVRLSRKRFRVFKGRARAGRGSVLSFSSNRAGHLSLLISRVGKRKAKPKAVSRLGAAIKHGRSSVLLSGEIGRGRVLGPGRYQVTLRVRDPKGASSDAVSVPFTVLPG